MTTCGWCRTARPAKARIDSICAGISPPNATYFPRTPRTPGASQPGRRHFKLFRDGARWSAACETVSWSPAYGDVVPAPVLHFSRKSPLPATCVTLLALNQTGRVLLRNAPTDLANIYLCRVGKSQRLVAFAERIQSLAIRPHRKRRGIAPDGVCGGTDKPSRAQQGDRARIGGESPELRCTSNDVLEAVANDATPFFSAATTTALLQALERL